jgi:GNAT superfamily N-acetyltransferase
MADAALVLRPAVPADAPLIADLVRELAAFEKLSQAVDADEAMLAAALFADVPRVFCTLAYDADQPAGFILWFYTFSTFRGRHGIWIEDLYVREEFRGKGIGRALLALLARRCHDEKLVRLEWAVLDWNARAIGFYEALGARLMQEWTICRLEDVALEHLSPGV